MTAAAREVSLKINGRRYRRVIEPRYLLADFLRHEIGLKGTHIGCEQGVCGACTVLIDGRTARSCLHFAIDLQDCEIVTVEGLADDDALHPIQQAFHELHAVQCGFCTPGFLLTTLEFLGSNPKPSADEIRAALTVEQEEVEHQVLARSADDPQHLVEDLLMHHALAAHVRAGDVGEELEIGQWCADDLAADADACGQRLEEIPHRDGKPQRQESVTDPAAPAELAGRGLRRR